MLRTHRNLRRRNESSLPFLIDLIIFDIYEIEKLYFSNDTIYKLENNFIKELNVSLTICSTE